MLKEHISKTNPERKQMAQELGLRVGAILSTPDQTQKLYVHRINWDNQTVFLADSANFDDSKDCMDCAIWQILDAVKNGKLICK